MWSSIKNLSVFLTIVLVGTSAVWASDEAQLALLRPTFPGRHAEPEPPDNATAATQPSATQPAPGAAEAPALPPEEPLEDRRTPEQRQQEQALPPIGFAGAEPSRQTAGDFLPIQDRWRIGIPGDYTEATRGGLFDPYEQNVLKGDYPILDQDKFLVLTFTSDTLFEARKTPTPSDVSTLRPHAFDFFGYGESQILNENLIVSGEFFQGDAAYKPRDWEVKFTGVANGNFVHAYELTVVDPDVRQRRDRADGFFGVQEAFYEYKIADLSPNYDFISVRAGIQGFTSDFRGFLFSDNEPGVRLFGTFDNNRLQYNLVWFAQLEKDTNSGLNTLNFRNQNVFIANVFRQDFIWEGYTAQLSFHANIDRSGRSHYDTNGFLVRPEPVGTVLRKDVNAYYLGWAGDGHIGRFNITHQFYEVLGNESFNQIAGRETTINAQFVALELSYDFDYIRYRASFLWSSGDSDPENRHATGFDSIFDNPNFAGGPFSYFDRQVIKLTGSGVNLTNRFSLIPDLRTSKEQGQANFVNPGLFLYNIGADIDLTPKLTLITNLSYLKFQSTAPLELILQDHHFREDIGIDASIGVRYRPLLSNNIIITGGVSTLIPGHGFRDIYTSATLYSAFIGATLTY